MKIMHIVEGFGGGVYSFLVDLCNGLSSEDEVILVYSTRPQTPSDFKKDFNKNIKLINLQMNRSINLIKDGSDFLKLMKIIRSNKPDIVHLHSSKAGVLGRLACTILRYNSSRVFYNPHGYAFLQKNASNVKRKIYFSIEKISSILSGTIIAVSNGEYIETLKFTKKVIRIDNAIDNNKLDKLISKKGNSRNLTFGTIGRISHQKNPKVFNEIANRFLDYQFIWIGDGELKSLLTSENIKITGWVARYEAIKLMNEVDVYLLTSLWEGMPIALLEAMYMKKVPVVSNVIGNNDVIINNKNGFLVDSIDQYESVITNLINDRKLIEDISVNAKDHIVKNHLVKDMIKKYKMAYKS